MVYYLRKISRPKWQAEPLSDDYQRAEKEVQQVRADAITNCLKTTGDRLSLWKLKDRSNSVDDVVPLILGYEKPNGCDVVYIPEDILEKAGIDLVLSPEDANVPLEELKQYHYNALVQNYEGLGRFARVVLMSLGSYKRYTESVVKKKLAKMLETHEIEKEMIANSLYEKVN